MTLKPLAAPLFAMPLRARVRRAGRLSMALVLTVTLVGCSGNAAKEGASDSADGAGQVEPGAQVAKDAEVSEAEAQQAAIAEWEAQRAKIKGVLDSMDRAEIIGDSATKGPLDSDVILLKFSDFECPFCALESAKMKDFIAEKPDVLYVYKQFPLVSIHDEAMPAAKAAWAAGQQDQFWIYHDGLFAFQDKLSEDYYVELAEQIGLDMAQFERDRNSPEAQAAIDKDVALAKKLEIGGTPTFIMNDLLIPGGAPLDFFKEAARRLKAGEPL
ncbi:MAG: thioredoxin domain-containing protein [Cyanobacteria bacterium J06634_5]